MTEPTSAENPQMLPEGNKTIQEMVRLFENMDDLLIKTAREALQHHAGDNNLNHIPLPTSEADLRLLEAARDLYRISQFQTEEMVIYLASLPNFDAFWNDISRTILRYFQGTVQDRKGEWRVWLRQVQRAGEQT